MDEIFEQSGNRNIPSIRELSRRIFQKNVELGASSPDEKAEFLSKAVECIRTPPPRYWSEPDWNRARVLVIVSAISLCPNLSRIPVLPSFSPSSEQMFSLMLILNNFRNDDRELVHRYKIAFGNGMRPAQMEEEARSFYSKPASYYLQSLPGFLKKNLHPREFTALLEEFFDNVVNMRQKALNVNFVSFAADMFRNGTQHIMQMKKNIAVEYWSRFTKAFLVMLKACASCPSAMLVHLLHPWVVFLKSTDEAQRIAIGVDEQTEILTCYCEDVAKEKYHELYHRAFPWHIEIGFYGLAVTREQRSRVLTLFCYAFRSMMRLESMTMVSDATKELRLVMANQRIMTRESCALFYTLSSCESTLQMGISDLKRVHGILWSVDEENEEAKRRLWISFADQNVNNGESDESDGDMGTWMTEYFYRDEKGANIGFDKQITKMDLCKTRLMTVIKFQFVFIEIILEDLMSSNVTIAETAFHYISTLVKQHMQIVIYASHRTAMLQRFAYQQGMSSKLWKFLQLVEPSKLKRTPDFSILFQRFVEFLERVPVKYHAALARQVALMIHWGHQKGIISLNFAEVAQVMRHTWKQHAPTSLFSRTICELMQIMILKLDNLMSRSVEQGRDAYRWLLLVIRLAGRKSGDQSLLLFMKNYQSLVFDSVVSNIKNIALANIAMKVLDVYMRTIDELEGKIENPQDPVKPFSRLKCNVFDDLPTHAKIGAVSTFFRIGTLENDAHAVATTVAMAHIVFQRRDALLIKQASAAMIARLHREHGLGMDSTVMFSLTKSWFEALRFTDQETAISICGDIKSFLRIFARPAIRPTVQSSKLIWQEQSMDIGPIINEIAVNISDDDTYAKDTFAFVLWAFDIVKQNISCTDRELRQPQYQLISLLVHCSNFGCLKSEVAVLCKDLIRFFGGMYVEKGYNLFLLNIMLFAVASSSENSRFVIDMAVSFLEYAQQRGVAETIVSASIESALTFSGKTNQLLSVSTALALFLRFFPACVTIDHMRSLLISSRDIVFFDAEMTRIIHNVVDSFLKTRGDEAKKEFVYMFYSVISTTVLHCGLVVLKQICRLGVPVPVRSNEAIEDRDPSLTLQKLSACLMCGTEVPLEINVRLKTLIHELVMRRNENVPVMEKLSRRMTLYRAIIQHDLMFRAIATDAEFVNNILNFLCNTMSSRFPMIQKNAEDAFRMLMEKYPDDEHTSRQVDEYCNNPSRIFGFFSLQLERITFYRRLTKILPNRMPDSIVKDFMTSIFEYAEFKDVKKFAYVTNLVHFVKYLAIEPLMSRPKVRMHVLSHYTNDTSYLCAFITNILELYHHPEIPFRAILHRYVRGFLAMFVPETIDCLCATSRRGGARMGGSLLNDLVFDDQTNAFGRAFLDCLNDPSFDIASSPPHVMVVLREMAKQPRFVKAPEFIVLADRLFDRCLRVVITVGAGVNEMRPCSLLMESSLVMIETLSGCVDLSRIVLLMRMFDVSGMLTTHSYERFITVVFRNASQRDICTILDELVKGGCCGMSVKSREIIVGHVIKYAKVLDAKRRSEMWGLLESLMDRDETLSVALIGAMRLIQKELPPREQCVGAIRVLKRAISSPATHVVVHALKLACVLMEKSVMSDSLFYQMAHQLFSYTKFFDMPYASYVIRFLNIKPSLLRRQNEESGKCTIPDDLLEAIAFFPHDKFLSIREMKRCLDIFTQVPHVCGNLSFSVLVALAERLEIRLLQEHATDEREFDVLLKAGIQFGTVVKPSKPELERWFKTCFIFLRFVLGRRTGASDSPHTFPDSCVQYLLKNNCEYFDASILVDVAKAPFTSVSFALVCAAANFNGDILVSKHAECVTRAIAFGLSDTKNGTVNQVFLMNFVLFLTTNESAVDCFQEHVLVCTRSLMSEYSEALRDRLLICAKCIIAGVFKLDKLRFLDEMWEFLGHIQSRVAEGPHVPGSGADNWSVSVIFRFLVCATEDLSLEMQEKYFESICLARITGNKEYERYFMSIVHHLAESRKLCIGTKTLLFEVLPDYCWERDEEAIACIIQDVENYGKETSRDVTDLAVSVLFMQYEAATSECKRKYLEQISDMLPDNWIEFMLQRLPIKFWNNEHLCTTVAVCFTHALVSQPMYVFGRKLQRGSHRMIETALRPFLNDDTRVLFGEFFVKVLWEKPGHLFTQIISGLFSLFHSSKFDINSRVAQRALAKCDSPEFIGRFLDDTPPTINGLLSSGCNDAVFGHFAERLSQREAAAAAMTLLNQYEAALPVYAALDFAPSPFFVEMSKVNAHFVVDPSADPDLFLRAIRHPGTLSDTGVEILKAAVAATAAGESQRVLKIVEGIDVHCANIVRRKTVLSVFDREQLIALQAAKEIVSESAQGLALRPIEQSLIESVNPAVIKALERLQSVIYVPNRNGPQIITGGELIVSMSPASTVDFGSVVGITDRGLLELGKRQIDEYFDIVSDKVASGRMEMPDWFKFAPFCFNVFLSKPTSDLFSVAFAVYGRVIASGSQSIGNHALLQETAAARIVTLARIAVSRDDVAMRETVQAAGFVFQKEHIDIWRPWLMQLVGIAKCGWFCSLTSDLFREMWYRSFVYAEKMRCHDLANSLQNQCQTHKYGAIECLKGSLDDIFGMDFRSINMAVSVSGPKDEDGDVVCLAPGMAVQRAKMSLTAKELAKAESCDGSERDHLLSVVRKLNNSVPLIFPGAADRSNQICIVRFDTEWRLLSPELLVCYATTSTSPKQAFLIQKSARATGFKATVLTFLNIAGIFKRAMQSSYVTRTRSVSLSVPHSFEVGPRYIMAGLNTDIMTLENLFEQTVRVHPAEWLRERTDLPDDALVRFAAARETSYGFCRYQTLFIRALAGASVVSSAFLTPYLPMNRFIIGTDDFSVPVIQANRELQTETGANFRISPNIAHMLGRGYKGHFILHATAAAHAIISNLELLRAVLEVEAGDQGGAQSILGGRTEIEQRLLDIAPPSGPMATVDDCESWYSRLVNLVELASNTEVHNPETIPWF